MRVRAPGSDEDRASGRERSGCRVGRAKCAHRLDGAKPRLGYAGDGLAALRGVSAGLAVAVVGVGSTVKGVVACAGSQRVVSDPTGETVPAPGKARPLSIRGHRCRRRLSTRVQR